ncbi:hypothetical protein APHAL10511_007949 [Amanita phalloides]|nr:hypothetical protein APHAL10511_007949 [Amanita phalloides]
MPVLPSFITNSKGKRSKFKVPTKYPFSARRPNISALCSSSSEVIHIHDKSASQIEAEEEEFVSKGSLESDNDEHKYHYEPLDLNISPEPLMSSFPSRFLKHSYIHPDEIPFDLHGANRGGTDNAENASVENNGFATDEEDTEQLIAQLRGMDASSFVGTPSSSTTLGDSSRRKSVKKFALTPIQVQTSRPNYDNDYVSSQPPSPASSAVSGTTLARALISNSFVLSIDTRDSRKYRSGVSTLTRTDSATLPMGDHPFLSSLHARERGLGGEGVPPWANSAEDIPPVPPMPSEAELQVLASKAYTPHSGAFLRKTGDFKRHSSTGSLDLARSPELSAPVAYSDIPVTAVIDSVSAGSVQASRRINRITEATSSAPASPALREVKLEGARRETASLEDVSSRLPVNVDQATVEGAPKPLPLLPSTPHIPDRAGEDAYPREVDNVIDYYSAFSPDVSHRGFKPAISPITEVSETSPAISPFAKHSSRGSSMISPSMFSPLSPEYMGTSLHSGSRTQTQARLPIRDRPQSSLVSTFSRRQRFSTSFSSTASEALVASSREPFNRKRSGSAPSPIVVVRDPQDSSKFRVTIAPDNNAALAPPTRDTTTQTFPETPLYTPMWTPIQAPSTSITTRLQQETDVPFSFVPHPPESPDVSSFGNMQTSPTQTMLMTRAASGARHSRQSSSTRNRDFASSHGRNESMSQPSQPSEEKADTKKDDVDAPLSAVHDFSIAAHWGPMIVGSSSLSNNDGNASRSSSRDGTSKRGSITGSTNTTNSQLTEQRSRRQESSSDDALEYSNSGSIYFSISRNASQSSRLDAQDSSDSFQTPSASQYPSRQSLTQLNIDPSIASSPSIPSLHTHPDSPPAYDTVFGDRIASDSRTPSTAGFDYPQGYKHSSHVAGASQSRESLLLNSRRQRQRPRLPAGPRERRDGRTVSHSSRNRNGSVSSVASTVPTGIPRAPTMQMPSPHFDVPSPKFKGMTMDAAKWTFTSAELQAIVSRAIQQSAEALSIRLLHLDVLDNDIPEDLHRLEVERREIQSKYRSLSHWRNKLLDTVSSNSNSHTLDSPGSSLRVAETLRAVCNQLDRLAEDHHSVDEQIACLNLLVLKHSGSALAMALRKLNKSFLEKLAELEFSRHQMAQLETERNEAMKQAEEATQNANKGGAGVQPKPSIRRFKAGLQSRPPSLHIGRASISSVLAAGMRSPFAQEDVPPVPAIHRRGVPDQIRTDIPLRSANPLSASGFTPTTPDSRTLMEQEELYVDIERRIGARLRRSRSIAALLTSNDIGRQPRSPVRNARRASRRPTSLPGDSRLSDAYKVMNADSNAMLLTLRMLSDAA